MGSKKKRKSAAPPEEQPPKRPSSQQARRSGGSGGGSSSVPLAWGPDGVTATLAAHQVTLVMSQLLDSDRQPLAGMHARLQLQQRLDTQVPSPSLPMRRRWCLQGAPRWLC